MNLVFKTLLSLIVTYMVIAFGLMGTSLLMNNFGIPGFTLAPIVAISEGVAVYLYWRWFFKKQFKKQ